MNDAVIGHDYCRHCNESRGRETAMNELRPRVPEELLQGRIYVNNRRSNRDCLILDFSDRGAKLTISDSVALPEVVELYIPHEDETYRAKVQWRTGFELGVAFNVQEDSPSIVPNTPDLAGRVRKPVTRDDGFHFRS